MKEKICWIKVSLKIVSLCRGIVDSMKYGLDTKRKDRQTGLLKNLNLKGHHNDNNNYTKKYLKLDLFVFFGTRAPP